MILSSDRILFRKFQSYVIDTKGNKSLVIESYLESFKAKHQGGKYHSVSEIESYLESFKDKWNGYGKQGKCG